MKTTKALFQKLKRLSDGEVLPSSCLKGDFFERMMSEEILVPIVRGSRKSFRARSPKALSAFVESWFGSDDLDALSALVEDGGAGRARQVKVSGDSKLLAHRTFTGFLVNSYEPLGLVLSGKEFVLCPEEGTFVFIYDYESFAIPEDVLVVGVENAENFRHIRRQRAFFESCFAVGTRLLFVSRYPQGQSKDLLRWLESIPNRYCHFGDLDLAGISIFMTEYFPSLGNRSFFLVPSDYEERLAAGSRKRYEDQYQHFSKMQITDSRLVPLAEAIHTLHRGYDQEGFIEGD